MGVRVEAQALLRDSFPLRNVLKPRLQPQHHAVTQDTRRRTGQRDRLHTLCPDFCEVAGKAERAGVVQTQELLRLLLVHVPVGG